jgi:hypothetical protein
MKYLKTFNLFEKADDLYVYQIDKELSSYTSGSYPFQTIKSISKTTKDKTNCLKPDNLILLREMDPHKVFFTKNKCSYELWGSAQGKTAGRIWLKEKVIGFWTKTISLKDVISQIEQELINVVFNGELPHNFWDGWLVDITMSSNMSSNDSVIVPLEQALLYDKNLDIDITAYNLHLMKADKKKKALHNLGYKNKQKSNKLSDVEYNDITTRYKFTESKK